VPVSIVEPGIHQFKKNIQFSLFWQNVFIDEFRKRITEIVSLNTNPFAIYLSKQVYQVIVYIS
jgi:hypothetical protein